MTSAALSPGSTSASTRSMPTWRAIAWAVRRCRRSASPPRASAAQGGDRLARLGFTVSATAMRPALAVDGHEHVLPARRAPPSARRGAAARCPRARISRHADEHAAVRRAPPRPGRRWPETPTGGRASPRALASATMASPSGCSDPCSAAAASARSSSRRRNRRERHDVGDHRVGPRVRVPVLSSTTTVTRWAPRAPRRFESARRARRPRPVADHDRGGRGQTQAQGQAITSTATALASAWTAAGAGPNSNHTTKVSAAMPITTGTNTAATRSARRWMGAGALRLLDEPDDLRERGVRAHARGAEGEAARCGSPCRRRRRPGPSPPAGSRPSAWTRPRGTALLHDRRPPARARPAGRGADRPPRTAVDGDVHLAALAQDARGAGLQRDQPRIASTRRRARAPRASGRARER